MIGFSTGMYSPSPKPKPPPKPQYESATAVDPPTHKKKRQEEFEENKESKNATAKRTTKRVTPISSSTAKSIEKHVLRSRPSKQISPKPQSTVVPHTHRRVVSSTFKKEEEGKVDECTTTTAKSVITRTRSKSATTRRVTSTRVASGSLDSTEKKSPKPLKIPEPVTKKRLGKSEGEKGFESPTTTAKPIIPGSKSQATRSTPTSAAPSPRSSSVESSPLYSNTSSPRDSKIEKHLPNGDLYIGGFSGNFPHGSGKYLWKDGSMYEGEWKRGKATGKGKFSWPSGASFEGEFKSGRREGSGTFIGPGGDRYKGTWLADQKHGQGVKYYCNGDYYEGHWRKNLQDGNGRYVCENGNQYVGEWKNGVINGRGELVWANGNRYQGNWENGVPTENGVVTWPDGSRYIGSWVRDGKNHRNQVLKGTFFPSLDYSGSPEAGSERFGGKVVAVGTSKKRSSVDGGGRGSVVERNFSSICIWESDAEAGNITGDIIDTVESSMIYGDFERENQKQFRWRNSCSFSGEVKKPGMTISKGHKNYDLMLNLQLGIRHSVEKYASNFRGLEQSDYDPKEKFWTRFPLEGSKSTPPHQSVDFRWKDYCPMVFRHLRQLFQVDPEDYMLSICGSDSLREFSSPGKSGSSFYLTQDDRFIIKTVKKSEVKVLIKMLRSYHDHVDRYENSLLTKFYGVHCVKPVGGTKTRFIVMGNLFCSEYRIHRRFDLKGSSHGRATDKAECEIDETTTFKDLDLNYAFWLQENSHVELIKQIQRDCEFLEAEKIMDYSFLVGMHFPDNNTGDKMGLSPVHVKTGKSISYQDLDRILSARKPLIRLGVNMPATAERVACKSDFDQYTPGGEIYEVVLYFGIIDMLQDYHIGKKLEHAYKSLQVDPTSISAVDPKLYSKRFQDFIGRIFRSDRLGAKVNSLAAGVITRLE